MPTSVAIPDEVLYQQVKDEIVLLNLEDQKYYGLDDVGAKMWELLVEHKATDTVVDRLKQIYDAPREVLEQDLERLVAKLSEAGLLKING